MKGSDYIIKELLNNGVTDMFGYPGAVVCHLMDSAYKNNDIHLHLNYHEQASAFAACGYSQAGDSIGVAYSNGGPGVTNLITGIADAWYDSLPTVFITGQVDNSALRGNLPIRQKGIQEIPTGKLVSAICKYHALVDKPEMLRYYMERACWEAKNGRPGPVVLEIPADIQRQEIDYENSEKFISPNNILQKSSSAADEIIHRLSYAKRPCIVIGNGVKISKMAASFRRIAERLQIPILFTLPAFDLLPFEHKMNFGFIGNNGNRYSNFIISKADLIITIGSRLDSKQVGNDRSVFALNADLVRVDIDCNELKYAVRADEVQLEADIRYLLPYLEQLTDGIERKEWITVCQKLKEELYGYDFKDYHYLIQKLGNMAPERCCFTADVGQHQIYMAQALQLREGQKVVMSTGLATMGYSLPAAIGAFYATGLPVICFCGDGGLQMNIQELQVLKRDNLPVKVIVFNNQSLGMIREFQERNFDEKYVHSVPDMDYTIPDTRSVANAYGISYRKIEEMEDINKVNLQEMGPEVIEIIIKELTYLYPRFVKGKPVCYMCPELEKDLYEELNKL